MNCFVLMPFDKDFEDVYGAIQTCVEKATESLSGRCFRLDENQPAGRITDRLLKAIESASFCIADLTGNKPNVMWELGYAMALHRPTIIVTQRINDLPFDVRDMQSLQYDRNLLKSTLTEPLRKMIIDTISEHRKEIDKTNQDEKLIGQLLAELSELKGMVAQAVRAWNPASKPVTADEHEPGLRHFEGAWLNRETRSHIYAKIVNDQLVAPYCYGGDNELTGVYFGWRRTGDYWFGRFAWLDADISGFAFMKEESVDLLSGAWWDEFEQPLKTDSPPQKSGVPTTWQRMPQKEFPAWATRFIHEVEINGLPNSIKQKVVDRDSPT